jgi:hypothetical protein
MAYLRVDPQSGITSRARGLNPHALFILYRVVGNVLQSDVDPQRAVLLSRPQPNNLSMVDLRFGVSTQSLARFAGR